MFYNPQVRHLIRIYLALIRRLSLVHLFDCSDYIIEVGEGSFVQLAVHQDSIDLDLKGAGTTNIAGNLSGGYLFLNKLSEHPPLGGVPSSLTYHSTQLLHLPSSWGEVGSACRRKDVIDRPIPQNHALRKINPIFEPK